MLLAPPLLRVAPVPMEHCSGPEQRPGGAALSPEQQRFCGEQRPEHRLSPRRPPYPQCPRMGPWERQHRTLNLTCQALPIAQREHAMSAFYFYALQLILGAGLGPSRAPMSCTGPREGIGGLGAGRI